MEIALISVQGRGLQAAALLKMMKKRLKTTPGCGKIDVPGSLRACRCTKREEREVMLYFSDGK